MRLKQVSLILLISVFKIYIYIYIYRLYLALLVAFTKVGDGLSRIFLEYNNMQTTVCVHITYLVEWP